MKDFQTPKQVYEFARQYEQMWLALVQCEAANKVLREENEALKKRNRSILDRVKPLINLTMKKLLILFNVVVIFVVCVACKKDVVMTVKRMVPKDIGMALDTSYSKTVQTFDANGDTILTTTYTTVVIKKYIPPVPVDSNSFPAQPLYKSASPVTYYNQSNFSIKGLNISGGTYGIYLNGCSNVTIDYCRIAGATKYEIYLWNCKNINIVYNYISGGVSGVHAENSTSIRVDHNQITGILGPYPGGNFVQFVNVSSPKTSIRYNRCEDIEGVGKPEDGLSVYKSNGIPGDSIMVIGNWIRGGQYYNTSGGAAGIVLGDVGGSYQVARGNILVNPGFVGAQVQGGSHIKMDHNMIYSSQTPYSNDGMSFGNYSGQAVSDINMSYNKIRFYNKTNVEVDMWVDPRAGLTPTGWSTNIGKASIGASILPTTLMTWK